MAITSRARPRLRAIPRSGASTRPTRRRPGPVRLSAIDSAPHHPRCRTRPRGPSRRVLIAALGAAFSLLLTGVMITAAIVCANGACGTLPGPGPTRAVLDLDPGPPEPAAPVTLGRQPTADPIR